MKISDIRKSKKEKDVMPSYAEEPPVVLDEKKKIFPKPKEMSIKPSFSERLKSRQQEKLLREEIKYKRLQKKLEIQKTKAEYAEAKKRQREASPLHKIPGVIGEFTKKPSTTQKVAYAKASLTQAQMRREAASSRRQLEAEREERRKHPLRPEGEGELPYYEVEYGKPLPKREYSSIGITNHERIPKKKSLKDELL